MKKVELSIILPVFNEGLNLRYMLRILEATIDTPHELLVTYDFPEDDSIPVVKENQKKYPNIRLIHNTRGKGVLNAVHAGVTHAKGKYILILTADDIGPVLTVEPMIKLMKEGCDMVSATRYAKGGRVLGGYFLSRLFSRTINKMNTLLHISILTDATVGLKMFTRQAFMQTNFESRQVGWAFAYEFALKTQYRGLQLGEVPIISINRFYGGKSSFRVTNWAREYLRWFLYGLKKTIVSRKQPDHTHLQRAEKT